MINFRDINEHVDSEHEVLVTFIYTQHKIYNIGPLNTQKWDLMDYGSILLK